MRLIDEQYTRTPFYGVRKMRWWLREQGYGINAKRVRRIMRQMDLAAIYRKPRLSKPEPGHRIYPYLLSGMRIDRPNQVWTSDITYIRLRHGFIYLVAVMDWFSRYVLAWEASVSLETSFCVAALDWALQHGRPEIFNHRQHLHRTSVANGEIRRGLSEGLPGRAGSAVESQKLFCFLQSRTTASSAGLPNAGDGSFSSEEAKTGDAGSRPARRSSPINGPGPKRFGRTDRIFTKKEKSSKKERKLRKGRPVETAASVEKKQTASLLFSHSRLDKTERKTCSVLSTVPTGPNLHSLYMELQGTNRNGVFRIYGAYGKYGNPRKNARITTLSTSPKTALAAG